MRNSLFWRILVFFLILLFAVWTVFSRSSLADSLWIFILENRLLFLSLLVIGILSIYFLTSLYIQPIQKIGSHLDEPHVLTELFFNTLWLPPEIQRLYKSMLAAWSNMRREKDEFLLERSLFCSILANMNDGILVVDEGDIVTLINQSACSLININSEEAQGRSLAEVIRHFKMNELLEKTRAAKNLQISSFETAPNKTYIRCIATPLDQEKPGTILFLLQDLTRIRQLEIIRRDFVSNVSHELRTPLTSLKLITETLQDDLYSDPEQASRFLNQMNSEIDNLTQIVEELLELSRIESGQVPLEKRWVKPAELISSACDRMNLQAERVGLTCRNSCPSNLPSILVDKSRLERVLVNLLHNAIKFTSPGGEIEVSAFQQTDAIVFSVRDSGIGIPPADLSRIFERFFKSDRSRSERGTGLGLSISRHLVEAHGGKIWAVSQPGQGSEFFFNIPLQ